MIDLIFIMLFIAGCVCWVVGIVSILILGNGLTPMNLFLIIIGGQLARLGWVDVTAHDAAKKHAELMKAIKDRLKW